MALEDALNSSHSVVVEVFEGDVVGGGNFLSKKGFVGGWVGEEKDSFLVEADGFVAVVAIGVIDGFHGDASETGSGGVVGGFEFSGGGVKLDQGPFVDDAVGGDGVGDNFAVFDDLLDWACSICHIFLLFW